MLIWEFWGKNLSFFFLDDVLGKQNVGFVFFLEQEGKFVLKTEKKINGSICFILEDEKVSGK